MRLGHNSRFVFLAMSIYIPMTSSMTTTTTTIPDEKICYMIGDSAYDDQKLYDLSINRGFELICPVQRI